MGKFVVLVVAECRVNLYKIITAQFLRHSFSDVVQRRLSEALGINARTYHSTYFTLNNRQLCILRDRSSGVEYLDTIRAVFWVSCNLSTLPEDWTILALYKSMYTLLYAATVSEATVLGLEV